MSRSKSHELLWHVLCNHEGRYSLAPAHHPVPAGWQQQGEPAVKSECLNRISGLWTDMRPNSLKEAQK